MQVLRGWNALLQHNNYGKSYKSELFCAQPQNFAAHLHKHVRLMKPRGLNARALGLVAARYAPSILCSADALAAHFDMLRDFFLPWSDELATDWGKTDITRACLPAVVHEAMHASAAGTLQPQHKVISSLHKAVLAGPSDILRVTHDGLREHMRTLVDAGLFDSEDDARQACMLRLALLYPYSLRWYLERKAAVLEAGGTLPDVVCVTFAARAAVCGTRSRACCSCSASGA